MDEASADRTGTRGEGIPEPGGPPRVVAVEPGRASLPVRALRKIARVIRRWALARRLAGLGRGSEIEAPAWIHGAEAISVGDRVRIWRFARLEAFNTSSAPAGTPRLEVGSGTVIQPFVHIGAAERVRIGKGCLFASHVYVTDHDHDWSDPEDPVITNRRLEVAPVEIGDFVWLGERVMVLKGVTIGERSIVGAGSIVTRDVPPYSVAVGSPARVVRQWDPAGRRWVRTRGT